MTLYHIHWRAVLTGKTGHGTTQFTKAHAEQLAAGLNRADTNWITHWAEPVPAATAADKAPTDKESTDN